MSTGWRRTTRAGGGPAEISSTGAMRTTPVSANDLGCAPLTVMSWNGWSVHATIVGTTESVNPLKPLTGKVDRMAALVVAARCSLLDMLAGGAPPYMALG